jgi:NADH:ubiquinone oxidoreductase subunit D
MNQELMDMAKQAHQKLVSEVYVGHTGQLDPWTMELLKIFAALVAAAEREKVATHWEQLHGFDKHTVAAFIRAGGVTK